MEQINKLIEESIVKYDNFGDKKPTKQSTVKAYRDIICKLHSTINPQSQNKYPNEIELCRIFENHNFILKKFDNGEWLDLSVATKKNYLNVLINIIPKIKSIEPHFSKSKKWIDKKSNELKVIMDNYKTMIDTINKCKKVKQQETNDLEKLKEPVVEEPVVEDPIDEPIEPIIEEPVVELTSMDEISNLMKLWNKQTELQCKRYSNEVDTHSWEFELEVAKQELHFTQKRIDLLNKRISNSLNTDDILTDQLKVVREEIEKLK